MSFTCNDCFYWAQGTVAGLILGSYCHLIGHVTIHVVHYTVRFSCCAASDVTCLAP